MICCKLGWVLEEDKSCADSLDLDKRINMLLSGIRPPRHLDTLMLQTEPDNLYNCIYKPLSNLI